MHRNNRRWPAWGLAVAAVAAGVSLAACSGGLSRSEVEDIVDEAAAEPGLSRSEVEDIVDAVAAEPGLSRSEVEDIVDAVTGESGLSRSDIEEIVADAVRGVAEAAGADEPPDAADAPAKSDPVAFTQYVVAEAIDRYETEGLAAALDHYNSPSSVDGQWYVIVIDADGTVIGHYDSTRRGNHLSGWVGTDVNGYHFGPDLLASSEHGRWVTYVYANPEAGGVDPSTFQLKSVWAVRHDGLLFASGWYPGVEDFVTAAVTEAAQRFGAGGIETVDALFEDPGGVFGGLESTLAYYESTGAIDREWLAFAAEPDGTVVSAYYALAFLGENIEEVLGVDIVDQATADGSWITAPSTDAGTEEDRLRIWALSRDGMIFGGGWYRAPSP